MTNAGYILGAWILVGVSMALYSVRLIVRGRSLTRLVEPSRRRWMTSPETMAKSQVGKNHE